MDRIPLFPLDVVLFPGELFGLHVFEERYLLMTEEVLAEDLPIGIVLARPGQPADRVEYEPEMVGTAAQVLNAERVGDRYLLQTIGVRRFLIHEVLSEKPYQEGLVEWLDETPGDDDTAKVLVDEVLETIEAVGGRVDWASEAVDDPIAVSHAVAASLPVDLVTKQRLLEAQDAATRLAVERHLLRHA